MEEKNESVNVRVRVRPSFCLHLEIGEPVFEGQIVSVTKEVLKGQEYKVEFIDSKEYLQAIGEYKEEEVKEEVKEIEKEEIADEPEPEKEEIADEPVEVKKPVKAKASSRKRR